jgi:hypothetical protein
MGKIKGPSAVSSFVTNFCFLHVSITTAEHQNSFVSLFHLVSFKLVVQKVVQIQDVRHTETTSGRYMPGAVIKYYRRNYWLRRLNIYPGKLI